MCVRVCIVWVYVCVRLSVRVCLCVCVRACVYYVRACACVCMCVSCVRTGWDHDNLHWEPEESSTQLEDMSLMWPEGVDDDDGLHIDDDPEELAEHALGDWPDWDELDPDDEDEEGGGCGLVWVVCCCVCVCLFCVG
jgi:hypothetical protein